MSGWSYSAMAGGAVGSTFQSMLFGQFFTRLVDGFLASDQRLQRFSNKQKFAWTDVFLGIAVTIQAPLHRQGLIAAHEWHLAYVTMATVTTNSLVDMNAVIEVDVVGQIVNSIPSQWSSTAETFADRFQHVGLTP